MQICRGILNMQHDRESVQKLSIIVCIRIFRTFSHFTKAEPKICSNGSILYRTARLKQSSLICEPWHFLGTKNKTTLQLLFFQRKSYLH